MTSTFTFSNDNRYFNPLCDSELLYDDKDGDTNRILCAQSTCIAPVFTPTGVPVLCDASLKPSGYTDRKFEWGVSDAAWTLNANYAGFTRLENQFVAPFQITASETGSTCMVEQSVSTVTVRSPDPPYSPQVFKIGYYRLNPLCFNYSFKKVTPTKVGYQPMAQQELAGTIIDAGTVGSKILKAYYAGPSDLCTDSNSFYEQPQISYFDVGTRSVPGSNNVTLKDAPISVLPVFKAVVYDDSDPFSEYGSWIPGNGNYGGYVECDEGNLSSRVIGRIYQICCAQKSPSLTVDSSKYPTDKSNLPLYRTNPYNFNPTLGAVSNFVKVSYDVISGVINNTSGSLSVVTGYRMQKYIQKIHTAVFSDGFPRILSGARHLETIMYPLGYTITWEFVSATPKSCVTSLFIPVYSHGVLVGYNGHPQARGDVVIKFTYTPFDYSGYYEYGPIAENNEPGRLPIVCGTTTGSLANSSTHGLTYNPPWGNYNGGFGCNNSYDQFYSWLVTGGRSDGAKTHGLVSNYAVSYGYGFGFGPSATDYVFSPQKTHYGSFMNGHDHLSDPLSPRYLKKVLEFEYPLQNKSPMSLQTVVNGVIIQPQPAQTSKPSNTAYLWRRLLGGLNPIQNTEVDFTFSNREQWFNGTCPFSLKYDNIESGLEYHPSSCSTTITPVVIPSGSG